MGVTDFHMHIQPFEMVKPDILDAMKRERTDFAFLATLGKDPEALLNHLDAVGVERAALVNYVAPDVIGFTRKVNAFVVDYCRGREDRLLPVGGIDPATDDGRRATEALLDAGVRMLKVHPPHQGVAANAYVHGGREGLRAMYEVAEERGVPVMIHTGTSIFPRARARLGDPMTVDDVAVDFPKLTILLAHGGRPLWCDHAFFLARRHRNVYLEVSSIPPARLLHYFPRLERIADKTVFGSDWPGPGVPGVRENLDAFRALPLSETTKRKILEDTARKIWP